MTGLCIPATLEHHVRVLPDQYGLIMVCSYRQLWFDLWLR